jgi:hypothetical protein
MHVIPMNKAVRRLLFEGLPLFDYDLRACHWSILLSIGPSFGVELPHVTDYVANRAEWQAHWRRIIGKNVTNAALKQVPSSWLTGGTLTTFGETRATQALGRDAIATLQRDDDTQLLYQEVRAAMQMVVKNHLRQPDGSIVNAAGATLEVPEGKRKVSFRSACSHILTGYEQFAIREICSRVPGLQAVIYDGFIAPQVPVEPLEANLRVASQEKLGVTLDLKLKVEDLATPMEEPERDEWSFEPGLISA